MRVKFRNYEGDQDAEIKWYSNTQSVEIDKRCQTIFKIKQNEKSQSEFELHIQVSISQ